MAGSERFVFLDAIRGLGAMTVVLHHLHHAGRLGSVVVATLPPFAVAVLQNAVLGYEIFFVISGFVMAYMLRGAVVTRTFFWRFCLRRSVRLDPPYWLTIALVLVCIQLSNLVFTDRVAPLPDAVQVAANMFYLHDLLGIAGLQDPFWTLCLEMQLYLLLAGFTGLVQVLERRQGHPGHLWRLAVLLLLVLASVWPRQDFLDGGVRTFLPWLFLFMMGATTWWTLEGRLPPSWWALFMAFNMARCAWLLDWRPVVSGLVAVAIFVGGRRGALGRWLDVPWVQHLGRISYPWFLTHGLVGGHVMSIGWRLTGAAPLAAVMWWVLATLASIGVAHAMHVLVEKRCLEWARRIPLHAERPAPAVAGQAAQPAA